MDVVINVGGSPWKKTAQLAEKGSKDMRQAENVHAIQEGRRNRKQPGGAKDSYPRDRDISCHRCGCTPASIRTTSHLQKVCRKKSKAPSTHKRKFAPTNHASGGGRVRTILLIFESPITTVNGTNASRHRSIIIAEETYRTLWMADLPSKSPR